MVKAYVLIEMAAGHARRLVDSLKGRDGVLDVARVTGPYDVIAVLQAEDVNHISDLVSREVHSHTGVMRTITCVTIG